MVGAGGGQGVEDPQSLAATRRSAQSAAYARDTASFRLFWKEWSSWATVWERAAVGTVCKIQMRCVVVYILVLLLAWGLKWLRKKPPDSPRSIATTESVTLSDSE